MKNWSSQQISALCVSLAALTLGLVLAFQGGLEPVNDAKLNRSKNSIGTTTSHTSSTEKFTPPSLASVWVQDALTDGKKFWEEERAARKLIASRETISVQHEVVEAILAKNRPHYDRLFDQWGLQVANRERVFATIRTREERLRALLMRRFADELDSSQYKKMKTHEYETAQLEMAQVLSDEQVAELVQLDRSQTAERIKAFRSYSPRLTTEAAKED